MKKRLSADEYSIAAKRLRTMKDIYWDLFHTMNGHFPKNSKTTKKLLKLDDAITDLYCQTEDEFFKDFPEKELKDFGK